jgi:hypothetical protein
LTQYLDKVVQRDIPTRNHSDTKNAQISNNSKVKKISIRGQKLVASKQSQNEEEKAKVIRILINSFGAQNNSLVIRDLSRKLLMERYHCRDRKQILEQNL